MATSHKSFNLTNFFERIPKGVSWYDIVKMEEEEKYNHQGARSREATTDIIPASPQKIISSPIKEISDDWEIVQTKKQRKRRKNKKRAKVSVSN